LLPDVDGAAEHYTEILGQGTIIPTNAIMIVERTHYFAKPGLAAEVLDQRRKACADLVADGTLSIVARSFFTTVKANTRNTLIATYEFAQRNDWEFRATAIEHEHVIATSSFNFDTAYLRDLFAYGYARGRSGRAWQTTLPR
jgi:hypothetical protein